MSLVERDLEKIARAIMQQTPLDYGEAMRLAVFIYKKEHPDFDDEVLA